MTAKPLTLGDIDQAQVTCYGPCERRRVMTLERAYSKPVNPAGYFVCPDCGELLAIINPNVTLSEVGNV